MKHTLRMLLGCLIPFLLIFLLPLFGVGEGLSLFVFIVLMFGCHLLMMGGREHGDHTETQSEEKEHHHAT